MQETPFNLLPERKTPSASNFVLVGGALLSFIYAFLLRDWNVTYLMFGVATLLSLIFLFDGTKEIKRRVKINVSAVQVSDLILILDLIVRILVIALAVTGYLLTILYAGSFVFEWLNNPNTDKFKASWAVCLLVLIAGALLWWIRLIARFWYGLVEVGVGLCVAFFQTRSIAPGISILDRSVLLALLTAAVYLVVRGIDNMHQGAISQHNDPVFKFIRNRIRS